MRLPAVTAPPATWMSRWLVLISCAERSADSRRSVEEPRVLFRQMALRYLGNELDTQARRIPDGDVAIDDHGIGEARTISSHEGSKPDGTSKAM